MKEKFGTPTERNAIASEILGARKSGEIGAFETNRSGTEYVYRLGGLKHALHYLKELNDSGLGSNLVLDIGAGTGRAIYEVSKMPMSDGFDFEVTALRNDIKLKEKFPKEQIHQTSIETLKGVKDNSVGLVIGVNSVAYSASPRLAVESIDRVLVPGGIFKGTFSVPGTSLNYNESIFKGPEDFIKYFSELGYDVSFIEENKFSTTYQRTFSNSVILAIKPGNKLAPNAKLLTNLDLDEMQQGAKYLKDGVLVYEMKP